MGNLQPVGGEERLIDEIIGGHPPANKEKDGPVGLRVTRTKQGILKEAYGDIDLEGVKNEAYMLQKLEVSGIAPKLLDQGENWILEEDLGKGEPIRDEEKIRHNMVRVLWELRQAGIHHGDMTAVNIIIKNNFPKIIDFQQSNLFENPTYRKHPLCDGYYGWRYVWKAPIAGGTPDTSRIVGRWLAVLGSLTGHRPNALVGKRLLDIGCFRGDFPAMAAAEGMYAHGIDVGGFRSGENSIATARETWGYMGDQIQFTNKNIMDHEDFNYDVVMMFSTWPYIVNDFDRTAAVELLKKIVNQCGVFFFETQLHGDGPGPNFLLEESDVASMFGKFAEVRSIINLPVWGRSATRTVWRIEKGES